MVVKSFNIPLQFNGASTAVYNLFVPFDVGLITVKQLSVVNIAAPTSMIGALKASFINAGETLCNTPLATGTSFSIGLNTKFIPVTKIINGNYTFSLVVDNATPIAGINTLNSWMNVTLEFSS
jgi:hypothetical protein